MITVQSMRWDQALYSIAHQHVQLGKGHRESLCWKMSLRRTICARVAFALNLGINVLSFPLAILFVSFGLILALSYWDFQNVFYRWSFDWIKTKTNHILLSGLGLIFPTLAYRFRDANLAPYVIVLRVGVLTWGFVYACSR